MRLPRTEFIYRKTNLEDDDPLVKQYMFRCMACKLYVSFRVWYDADIMHKMESSRCRCELTGDITDLDWYMPVIRKAGASGKLPRHGLVTWISRSERTIQLNFSTTKYKAGNYEPEWADPARAKEVELLHNSFEDK